MTTTASSSSSSQTSVSVPSVTLNDGRTQMPLLGLGTSDLGPNQLEALECALSCGYRFLDTAALYGNEQAVGQAIGRFLGAPRGRDEQPARASATGSRDELFVCSKVWCTAHRRASVVEACRKSLERLKLAHLDLYLIHWPVAYVEDGDPVNPRHPSSGRLAYSQTHFTETWLGMEDCKQLGLARAIGLSNFNSKQIDEILQMPGLRYKPAVNQVESHPYLSQERLRRHCAQHNIYLQAYCPLGSPGAHWLPPGEPRVLEDPLIGRLATKYNKSPAQICLRFQVQRQVAPIPKSSTPARIRQNLEVFDFELEPGELDELLALDRGLRYCLNTAGEYVTDHPLYPFHEEY